MAACGSLEHINIDKPLSENPTLLESLSPQKSIKTLDQSSSFTEIFSELQHFKENNHNHFHNFSESSFSSSPSSNSMFSADANAKQDENGNLSIHQDNNGSFTSNCYCPYGPKKQYRHSDSFSSMNSDNLSICTGGIGFESFDDVDDLLKNEIFNNNNNNDDCQLQEEKTRSFTRNENHWGESKRSRTCCIGNLPPPISCIGKSGKPFVIFKSFRQDGRFILKEIRIPELLHACRENGRLKLQLIQSDDDDDDDDDEILEEDEKEDNVEEKNLVMGKNDEGDKREEIGRYGEWQEKTHDKQTAMCRVVWESDNS